MRSRLFPALLLAASLSASPQAPEPLLHLEAHPFKAHDGRIVEAERGTLRVPFRQAHPKGPRLDLRFVRLKSTNPKPGSPIVYLAGGPGGSGIEAARGKRLELFLALREVADVIALDQRGTGESNPYPGQSQAWSVPLEEAADEPRLNGAAEDAARKAAKAWGAAGIDLGAFTTLESVGDLEALRRALGSPKLSLWGISYGTHLGLAYLRVHADRVDRAILAGLEGPDDTWKLPSQAEALLVQWEALAPASPRPLRARLKAILDELGRQPRKVVFKDSRSGAERVWMASRLDVQRAVFETLRDPSSFRRFLPLLDALEAGNFEAMAPFAARLRGGSWEPMPLAMDAASGVSPERRARIGKEAATALLGGASNPGVPEAAWLAGVPDLGEGFRGPLRSAVPVLLISGTLDGRTGPENAEALRPGLSKAGHLVLEGAGHEGLFQSDPRILQRMLAFLKGNAAVDDRLQVK
jgi:pimeloyl-ACP methyl ester carboxylesterase